ncbi:MAG: sialate O-acetylesterase [Pirellulaceae bacterium]|nr:sialate O-acetylesterase [Planctomycetales bacterium]
MRRYLSFWVSLSAMICTATIAVAEVTLPTIIGDHMVLQRDVPLPIWGWAAVGETVTVKIAGQTMTSKAGEDGRWQVTLKPLSVGDPLTMTVSCPDKTITVEDILVGEVWLCSGQSNMQWAVAQVNSPDLELAAANYPEIRLITNEIEGTQLPLDDFEGGWQACNSQTASGFSAVGYFFGRRLHQVLGCPIGLIDNAWGGSSCEAWIRRDLMSDEGMYGPLMQRWAATEEEHLAKEDQQKYETELSAWHEARDAAHKAGKPAPARPRPPQSPLSQQHRPGNLYNARILPLVPFAIRGAIWYQGESNAGRAYQYRDMFPLMIQNWRDTWQQGEFPFYWVQLADFKAESAEPGESDWAELREAQTMTLNKLKQTGEAVIIDIGEGKDIHPRNKQDVGDRLARWALAGPYGKSSIQSQSPTFKSMEAKDGKVVVTFDHVGGGLSTFDVNETRGFAIAGEDHKWVSANGKVVGRDQVELSAEGVTKAVAVRYAWADNPVCNLFSREGLPATPFRSDDWPGVTADAR